MFSYLFQRLQRSCALWLVCVVGLLCVSCQSLPPCSNEIGSSTLNTNQRTCGEDCDCNNQKFTGQCVQGICQSASREPCFRAGQKRYCELKDAQPLDKRCEWGVQICQDEGLYALYWGDCKPQSPADKEISKDLCVDGIDNDCNRRADFYADPSCKAYCVAGRSEPCYDWKDATPDKPFPGYAVCRLGTRICKDDNTWGPCIGAIYPEAETCDGKDNDCNGMIDDGVSGCAAPDACKKGETQPCYNHLQGCISDAKGVWTCQGNCKTGLRTCKDNNTWGECVGQIGPSFEDCNQVDDNCDGVVDEGCVCSPNTTQPCYAGEASTRGKGRCVDGLQTCQRGYWGACEGSNLPRQEECNGEDDNCNGVIDDPEKLVAPSCEKRLGVCLGAVKRCGGVRGWLPCATEDYQRAEPSYVAENAEGKEHCDGKDNDCDGQIDEGCTGSCVTGSVKTCYSGPQGTQGQGICREGIQVCQQGVWGACLLQVLPTSELCNNGLDDDCNGKIDDCKSENNGESSSEQTVDGGPTEALPEGPCQNGTTYPCPLGGVGVCGQGTTTCRQNVWGPCIQTHPRLASELCDGLDNNCDGQIDEGCPAPCLPNRFVYATPLAHTSSVYAVAFSPDEKTLASGSFDTTIRLVDVATGTIQHTLTGHNGSVNSVVFSPDGKTLISGSSDFSLRSWDTATGTLKTTITGRHTSAINSVAISPDGNTLASASDDSTIQLMEAATGKVLHTLKKHTSAINSIAFSPDSKLLASGASDFDVMLWDVATGTHLHTFSGHNEGVKSVVFSPNGKLLASGAGTEIRLWDPVQKTLLQTLIGTHHIPFSLVFSLDSKLLLTGGSNTAQQGNIEVWDLTAFTASPPLLVHSGTVHSIAISPDGKTFASGSADKTVLFWDLTTRKHRPTSGHTAEVNQVAFSVDGRFLASASEDTTAKIRETSTGKVTASLSHIGRVTGLVYTPDGKSLVTVTSLGKAHIWDLATGQQRLSLTHPKYISAVALSTNGNILACLAESTVYLWEMATGSQLRTISENSTISAVAFSPNNATLALALANGTLTLRDANTGTLLQTLTKHTHAAVSVAFSPDGKTLASGASDFDAMLWEVATGTHLHTLSGHTGIVSALVFSVDGKTLATASHDFSIKLWDVSTAKLHLTLPVKHTSSIYSLAISPDGKSLASGSVDTTVMLWECPCQAGATRPCYPGLTGCQLQTTGAFACTTPCKAGLQTCHPLEVWGPCLGVILPQPEIGSNGKDDDCDGKIDG